MRRRVEERYNCTIEGDFDHGTSTQFNDIIRNGVLSGSGTYDMVFDAYGYSSLLVTDNMYVDLNTIESLNFDQPWWDQNAKEDLSIDGKLYFMVGDINTFDNDGTWVMLFNRTLRPTSASRTTCMRWRGTANGRLTNLPSCARA